MSGARRGRRLVIAALAAAAAMCAGLLLVAAILVSAVGAMFTLGGSGSSCGGPGGTAAASQPAASQQARQSIPADYLGQFKAAGARYGVPWVVLAGISKVESDDGQSQAPGVHSGTNPFGAAGPMQIGVGGAAGNQWGGAPAHPASEHVTGVATDADGDGIASVYDPADAIAGAARYLVAHGALGDLRQAVFAYNHLASYVQAVLDWAADYASGGFQVSQGSPASASQCPAAAGPSGQPLPAAAQTAISYARAQLGKPYQYGATGPDAFDCSGLVLMAYRTAGIDLPRTSQQQWAAGPRVPASQVQPGDLVFFAGSDGTLTAPGHVGLVIGSGLMIDAPYTGEVVRVEPYAGIPGLVGFTRPATRPPRASAKLRSDSVSSRCSSQSPSASGCTGMARSALISTTPR